jgi:signal transduction histidine kinase/ActR/RegA family two-component response regulator
MGRSMRAFDWSATSIGPVERWPQSLRTAVSIVLRSKLEMCVAWGPAFIQLYNDAFGRLLGAHPERALGQNMRDTFATDWPVLEPRLARLMSGEIDGVEDASPPLGRFGHLQGRYFVYSYSPLLDDADAVGGVLISVSDRTAEVLDRQSTLFYDRSDLYELFLQAPAPIFVVRGSELVFEMANPSALRVIGRTEVLGLPILDVLPELGKQGLHARMLEVLRTGEPYHERDRLMRIGGAGRNVEERSFTFVFNALHRPSGIPDRVMVFGSEVTDQVRVRAALEDARRRAEDASRAKDEFLAMLGHELRNPLAPIATALELMQQGGSNVFVRERTIVGHQVQHLTRLVDDLLDVSRITRGKIQLRTRSVEIAEAVSRAIELASPLLEDRRHRLLVDVPPSGLLVLADELRLAQVVANLLTNAAKYTEPGGEIAIRAERRGSNVMLRVRDNGIGISSELAPRIFDLFVQGVRPQSGAGGLGLGLTLVRSLTELHGGTVRVHSAGLGKGSEFELQFPWLAAPIADAEREELAQVVPRTAAGGRRRRVMIVDDNEDAAELLAEGLRRCGHDVRVAFEGPRGIDLARAWQPHVGLLDLGLPVMDGYELGRRLRELPEAAGIQLIAVTGYGQDSDRKRSNAAGFARHLVKPVDLAQIDNQIRQLIPDEESEPT